MLRQIFKEGGGAKAVLDLDNVTTKDVVETVRLLLVLIREIKPEFEERRFHDSIIEHLSAIAEGECDET